MGRPRSFVLLPGLLLVTACPPICPVGVTEQETVDLRLSPLYASSVERMHDGALALQGSSACIKLYALVADGEWVQPSAPCHDVFIDDVPFEAGDCFELAELGELRVDLVARDRCGYAMDDRFHLRVIPIDGLRARLEWKHEQAALSHLSASPRPFPTDFIPAPDEPLRLVPGVEVSFPVNVIDADGARVGWNLDQGRLFAARAGAAPRELSRPEEWDAWLVSIEPGERETLTLELAGATLAVADVIATPPEQAASIEIVVARAKDDDVDDPAPVAARAVVRDAHGRVIYGAPVEWSLVEGHMVVSSEVEDFPVPEHALVYDDCEPPPTEPTPRRAVVRAQLGALVDEVEIEWTAQPDHRISRNATTPFEPDPLCQRAGVGLGDRGCQCSTRASEAGAWPWLAMPLVVLARRRRRRRPAP
jgi:MYXO-CTERM domain-containing protein